jgi:hypothetical protein
MTHGISAGRKPKHENLSQIAATLAPIPAPDMIVLVFFPFIYRHISCSVYESLCDFHGPSLISLISLGHSKSIMQLKLKVIT